MLSELRCAAGVHAQPTRPAHATTGPPPSSSSTAQFPRSVLFALSEAERRLDGAIDPATHRIGRPRRGPPPAGPDPHRARVPATSRTSSPTCPRRCAGPGAPSLARPHADRRAATSSPARCTTWTEEYACLRCAATASSTRPRSATTGGRPGVAQRAADDARLNEPGQTTLENRLRVRPMTWSHVYRDYWGTHVTAHGGARRALLARDRGDEHRRAQRLGPPCRPAARWMDLTDPGLLDRSYEWLMLSAPHPTRATDRRAGRGGARAAIAARRRLPASSRSSASDDDLRARGHRRAQPAASRRGPRAAGCARTSRTSPSGRCAASVCPARYVSGLPRPQARGRGRRDQPRARATPGSSSGTAAGCRSTRPTAAASACDHVVVARGRDYEDVQPFKGVYSGPADSTLTVEVRFTRLR